MSELARWRCPRCDQVADVWLDDNGRPESRSSHGHEPVCPLCLADRVIAFLQPDADETALFAAEPAGAASAGSSAPPR